MPTPPTPPTPPDPAAPGAAPAAPARAQLHHEAFGTGRPVVLAHGFTQTARVWGTLDRNLARDHRVVAVDMPGHGDSSGVAANLVDGALELAHVGGRAVYLGYSMGARFCLHLALARPEVVESLVLISGTAGIEDAEERRARCRADEALAHQLDPGPSGDAAVPVEVFLRRWMDNPMFAGVGAEAGDLGERSRNTGPGLASSLRRAGTGTQLPLWPKLDRLTIPVLVVTGEADAKFSALGRRMVEAIGANAALAVVPGAGHAPHLQRPDLVADRVRAHLARTR